MTLAALDADFSIYRRADGASLPLLAPFVPLLDPSLQEALKPSTDAGVVRRIEELLQAIE